MEKDKKINEHILLPYSLDYLREGLLGGMKIFEENRSNPEKIWAEYSHSEAVLELVEGISNNDIKKLVNAQKEINNTLKRNPSSTLYIYTKERIGFWISKLQENK